MSPQASNSAPLGLYLHWQNEDNRTTYFIGLLQELSESTQVLLGQCASTQYVLPVQMVEEELHVLV